jgi:hypothetical protein
MNRTGELAFKQMALMNAVGSIPIRLDVRGPVFRQVILVAFFDVIAREPPRIVVNNRYSSVRVD